MIADNVEDVLNSYGYDTFACRMEKLVSITNSSKPAVYAWLNHGRTNVKILFLKLCMIANVFDVSIIQLLSENKIENL